MFGWNKNCHWSHDWEKWSTPIEIDIMVEFEAKPVQGIKRVQRRTCLRCNQLEERRID